MRASWAVLILAVGVVAAPAWGAVAVDGQVYEDADGNGRFDAGERALAGVVVFWETKVFATTDEAGRFALVAPDDGIVWVRTPDGFSPEPTWAALGTSTGALTVDLGLRPAAATGNAVFVVGADSHAGIVDAETIAAALEQATDLEPPPHFMTVIGDIGNNTAAYEYEVFRAAWETTGIPLVPVVGNHDWYDGGALYRLHFGPPMYSFDSGGIHFVVLNSMAAEADRDAFLAADLALPYQAQLVAAFMHYPADIDTAPKLAAAGVDVLFTGHVHANFAPEHLGLKEYITETLVMGSGEFTPAGYRVVTHLGGGLLRVKNHTTVNERVAELLYPVPGTCAPAGRVRLVAAVEVGASTPLVTLTLGGSRVRLEPAGGWVYEAEVELGAREHHAKLEVGWGSGRYSLVRNYDLCVRTPYEPPSPSGDWPQLQGTADHRGAIATPLDPPLSVVWTQGVGGHVLMGSPVLAGGRIFASVVDLDDAHRGGVVALDARTGTILWEARPGPSVRNAAAVGDGRVVFVTSDGWLHAVDAETGAASWQVDIGLGNWSYVAPIIVDGQVLIATPQAFRSLDLATGAPVFSRDPGAQFPGLVSLASVAVGGGIAVTPMPEGRDGVLAWDMADGRELWRMLPPYTVHLRATPLVVDDTVFLANVESRISAVDLVTGQARWSRLLYDLGEIKWGLGVAGTPAFAGQRLFVPTSYGQFFAMDAQTGDIAWTLLAGDSVIRPLNYETVARCFLGSPVVTGQTVWVGGADGMLSAVHAGTGELLWSMDLGTPIVSGLVPSPPYLYVGTYDGTIRALVTTSSIPPEPPPHVSDCRIGSGSTSSGTLLLLALLVLVSRALLRRG